MTSAVYVITKGTRDYPDQVVLRRHVFHGKQLVADYKPLAVAKTLDELRKVLPIGLSRFDPWDVNDPVIVEWWA